MGVEVKNDIEDARVLSKAIHLAKDGQVKVPVFNEDVEQIKELQEKELRIIEQVQTLIDFTDEYRVSYENIISIKGVGQIASIVLLHLFLKYPEANQRQITSLTGLNPIYRQSGSSIQSGYKLQRQVLVFTEVYCLCLFFLLYNMIKTLKPFMKD